MDWINRRDDVLLIAATDRAAAESYAASLSISPRVVLGRTDLPLRPGALRRVLREVSAATVMVHSADWSRQGAPQLYELLAALAPAKSVVFVDDETGSASTLSSWRRVAPARIPFDLSRGAASLSMEWLLHRLMRNDSRPTSSRSPAGPERVLAIWLGGLGAGVGGAVTHAAGILEAFRARGMTVGLVSDVAPPPQLAVHIDDFERINPLARGERIISQTERIAVNREVRAAGRTLAKRLRPDMVYQRHRAYMTAGLELANALALPLVLEWNNSEAWLVDNWEDATKLARMFRRSLVARERTVAKGARLVAAVSRRAAAMAQDAGAEPPRVICVANAVRRSDVAATAAAPRFTTEAAEGCLGWVGSFGVWHGAEILIRALRLLPQRITAVLIGDGSLRPECERLAQDLGVNERIEWTGRLPHAEVVDRLRDCDVLVSPHIPLPGQPFFGSPTKIFEYMAIGRPIVASALEQIGEILQDGRTARMVVPGDAKDLAQGIQDVLGRPDRGRALAEAARVEVLANHTWDARAAQIIHALARLEPEHNPSAGSSP